MKRLVFDHLRPTKTAMWYSLISFSLTGPSDLVAPPTPLKHFVYLASKPPHPPVFSCLIALLLSLPDLSFSRLLITDPKTGFLGDLLWSADFTYHFCADDSQPSSPTKVGISTYN